MKNFKLFILQHDEASRQIAEYFKGRATKVKLLDKLCQDDITLGIDGDIIENIVRSSFTQISMNGATPIFLYGSGGYHHYTYGLCKVFADSRSKEYSYIHIDAHSDNDGENSTDGQIFDVHQITCGNFVNFLEINSNAGSIRIVGCNHRQFLNGHENFFSSPEMSEKEIREEASRMLAKTCNDVYISTDLDVLKAGVSNNYEPGILNLETLLEILKIIKNERNLIGADILGYDAILNKGHVDTKSIEVYEELVKSLT